MPTPTNTPPKRFAIMCGQLWPQFEEFLVETTHEQVLQMLNVFRNSRKMANLAFLVAAREVTKYSNEELSQHYQAQDQAFANWCDDVLNYATARQVLLDKPVPILELP